MTASEYYKRYSGKDIKIKFVSGDEWVGKMMGVVGFNETDILVPGTTHIMFDRFIKMEPALKNTWKQKIIDPSEISKIFVVEKPEY